MQNKENRLHAVRDVNKARNVKAKAKAAKPRPRPETCKAKAKDVKVNFSSKCQS